MLEESYITLLNYAQCWCSNAQKLSKIIGQIRFPWKHLGKMQPDSRHTEVNLEIKTKSSGSSSARRVNGNCAVVVHNNLASQEVYFLIMPCRLECIFVFTMAYIFLQKAWTALSGCQSSFACVKQQHQSVISAQLTPKYPALLKCTFTTRDGEVANAYVLLQV